MLPFCKFVCTNSSNQISFVRLTLYHFLLLSPLIKIEKVDPVYSVTIWVLLPSDNTIRLPHDWENGALVYSPLRLYIPLRQSYLNQYRDLYPLLSGKTSSVLPEGFVSMTFVLQYYFKCLLVYISFILFFFSYNDSFLNICYSFAMTINNVFFIY